MEIEITKNISLTDEQSSLISMHAFLNIMSILSAELLIISNKINDFEILKPSMNLCKEIRNSLSVLSKAIISANKLDEYRNSIIKNIDDVFDKYPEYINNGKLKNDIDNIKSIFNVLEVRVREILARVKEPEKWQEFDINEIYCHITDFLDAIQKNSKGHYKILFKEDEKGPDDYIVSINVNSILENKIKLPLIFLDVVRDTIANSRKYTKPGGYINVGLFHDGINIIYIVEDNGIGIPPDEIENVIDFGKRGKNVLEKETKGGGFGLTKAFLVTKQFGGRMWIDSALGKGTKIKLVIPNPVSNQN